MEIQRPIVANWSSTMRAWLETIDVDTGEVDTLVESNLPLQAPTWSPDGETILTNAAGRLYRLDLGAKKPALQDVHFRGFFSSNNDHGFSPDGQFLAISDKTQFGKSAIYLSKTGEALPRLIKTSIPAWFHGWSPDSTHLVYSCLYRGQWCLAVWDIATESEHRILTANAQSGHHIDAPEFSADGDWIWFNANMSGPMSLWRMRTDGTSIRQMTASGTEDWFPHPSPDGRHIAYLSYPGGTRGHPFGREVTLNLIKTDGGAPRPLRRLYGGHGTLNAPCWSPDGTKCAYIRFSKPDAKEAAPRLSANTRILPVDLAG